MKTRNRIVAVFIALLVLVMPAATFADVIMMDAQPKEVSIIFSHDTHSRMDSEKTVIDGKLKEKGGLGRVATMSRQIRQEYPDSIMVDAGDFSMGTAYQTVFKSEASELRMMGRLNYDAATFGNHEFDYGAQGLADMLNAARISGEKVPSLLCANIDWETSLAEAEDKEAANNLKEACDAYGVQDYVVIEKDSVKIAIFGIMGVEAASFAPQSGVYFSDPVEASKRVVSQIKENENVSVIICLSHSGTGEDPKQSEDEILAAEVPDIDVIVSAHTHTELPEPIMVGDTAIVSCGEYNNNLGHVVLKEQDDSTFAFEEYEMIPMDESVEVDPATLADLNVFRERVNDEYFSMFGYEAEQVLATNNIEFTPFEDFGEEKGEDTMGNLIADSYIYAVKEAEGEDSVPVSVAVAPNGVIRASLFTGEVTVADVFYVSPLGQGPDGISGYPLVSAYLTGKELKDLAEVDATVSDIMPVARLYMSGLKFDYNMHRMFLNRATDVQVSVQGGDYEKLENDKQYRIVADLYSALMLSIVKDESFGLLSVVPKDEEGNPITDFNEHIIYNGDQELKAWYALASYIDSFEGDQIPEKYAAPEGRKNDVTSWNPIELVKQPNKVGYILMAAVVVLILVVIGIVKLVKHIRRKHKNRK